MPETQLVPTEYDKARFISYITSYDKRGGVLHITDLIKKVAILGEMILDGEYVVVGTNVAKHNPDSIEIAERDDVSGSIIGEGVTLEVDKSQIDDN